MVNITTEKRGIFITLYHIFKLADNKREKQQSTSFCKDDNCSEFNTVANDKSIGNEITTPIMEAAAAHKIFLNKGIRVSKV